jgi:hypothetical protein
MGKIEKEETRGKVHCLRNRSRHRRSGIAGEVGGWAPLGSRALKASKSEVGGNVVYFNSPDPEKKYPMFFCCIHVLYLM